MWIKFLKRTYPLQLITLFHVRFSNNLGEFSDVRSFSLILARSLLIPPLLITPQVLKFRIRNKPIFGGTQKGCSQY